MSASDATSAARVEAEVSTMAGPAAPPRRNGELVFEAPWQGRAFGLALAVVRHLGVPWRDFRTHLIAEIATHPEAPYYDSWVAALERLVVERGLASPDDVDRASRELDDAAG